MEKILFRGGHDFLPGHGDDTGNYVVKIGIWSYQNAWFVFLYASDNDSRRSVRRGPGYIFIKKRHRIILALLRMSPLIESSIAYEIGFNPSRINARHFDRGILEFLSQSQGKTAHSEFTGTVWPIRGICEQSINAGDIYQVGQKLFF